MKISKRRLISLLISLLFAGCHGIFLWDPDAYYTGKVLKNREWEIEVRSNGLYVSPYPHIGLGYGLPNNFDIRGRVGLIGEEISEDGKHLGNINSMAVSLTQGFSSKGPFFTSRSLKLEILFGPRSNTGWRVSSGYALGFYPVSGMGIYLPLKGSWVRIKGHSVIAFTPGIGFEYGAPPLFIRAASNVSFYNYPGNLTLLPYQGVQIGIRW